MALGNRQEKKVKDETLGFSFTHKEVIEVDNATETEIAVKFGPGVNHAVMTWKGDDSNSHDPKLGITNTNGQTNVKLITKSKTYNMIAVAQLASAVADVTGANDSVFIINRGGVIQGMRNTPYANLVSMPKMFDMIPDGGVISEPIAGISIDSGINNQKGTLTIYY